MEHDKTSGIRIQREFSMRVSSLLLLTSMVVSIGLQSCQQPNGPEDPGYEKFDGFTSASTRLRVDSVLAYHDFALVYWWEYWECDADVTVYRIDWGTDSTNYPATMDLKPYEYRTKLIDTIQPLVPNTKYYARFFRDYHSGTVVITPFQFTTPAAP